MKTEKFDPHTQGVVDAYARQHPGATDGDIVRAVYSSDRGRFSYWFKFLITFALRWYIVAFTIACTASGFQEWVTGDMGQYESRSSMIWALIGYSLVYLPWFGWVDLINCIACYFGYRVNPSGGDIYEVLGKGTYARCTQRVINYCLWTLVLPILTIIYLALTH